MNATAISAAPSRYVRVLVAALLSFLLVVAGAFVAPSATAADASASGAVTSASSSGVSVQVQASGLGDVSAVYAALIVKGTEASITGSGGYAAFALPFPGVTDGATSFALTASAASLDRNKVYEVLIWQQHSNPNDSTIYARSDVSITSEQWDAVFGAEPVEETPEETVPEETVPEETAPEDTVATPSIEVFLADGVTPAGSTALHPGDEIVVKGSGYDPTANVGGRGVPIPSNLPQGTYVVFGNFADNWQPSTGAASSSRSVGAQKWALAESVLAQVPAQYQGAIRAQWVDIAADGTFVATLTLKDAPATPGSYGVYTYGAGGVSNAAQEQSLLLNYGPAPVSMISTSASLTQETPGISVRVNGSQFTSVAGVYAALIEAGTEEAVTAGGGFLAMEYVRGITAGSFTTDLLAAASVLDSTKSYEVIVWQQHTMPTADTIYARQVVQITPEQWAALFETEPETPTNPTNPSTPTTPTTPVTVPGGSLRWAISSSFTEYVTGSIAQGSIAVSGGATRAGGQFQFGQAPGSTYDAGTGLGTVSYRGVVQFTGHHGVLNVTVSNPEVRITSASTGTVYVTSGGTQIAFATLDLARATKSSVSGAVTYAAAPATLTAAGRDRVLEGFSTTLDPVTFTVGATAPAPNGTTGTVAAASVQAKSVLPSTPPATSGIEIDEENLAALQSGERATVTASGFQPNERGIRVVVYSSPVLLDTVSANAAGETSWTGTLPATLADGEHTLTLQGSVDRGLVFTLDRSATPALGLCVVEGASLNWGFKETFRNYIEGIAGGGWELTDVAYEYPEYVWANGAGSFDPEAGNGLIAYGGTIRFTGHGGALDTTLSNLRLELAGDVGYLVFDVTGTTQGGDAIDQQGVRLAEFSLDGVADADGAIRINARPATLTESGAAAFGTYPAGEALDPVSAAIPVDAECGTAPESEVVADTAVMSAAVQEAPAAVEDAPLWPWIAGGSLVVLLAIAAGVIIARRGKQNTSVE